MRWLYVLCEGQTEEALVDRVLAPHLTTFDVELAPVVVATKRPAAGGKFRGGVVSWAQVKREVVRLLKDRSALGVTTMIDLYGLREGWPGWDAPAHSPRERVERLEAGMCDDVGDSRFIAHLTLHEYETLVLACPQEAAAVSGMSELDGRLRTDAAQAGGPELVDDGPTTAPSKRLIALWPGYLKTTDGPTIVERAGLAAVREACPHFDAWITPLESQ